MTALYVALSRPLAGEAELRAALPAHLDYMHALETRGVLFASGPFRDVGAPFGVGMTIVRASSPADARALLDADPFIVGSLRAYELHEWHVLEGTVRP